MFKAHKRVNKAEPLVLSALLLIGTSMFSMAVHAAPGDREKVLLDGVSNSVWEAMKPNIPTAEDGKPAHPISASALKPVLEIYKDQGKPFKMGMVFPVSTHNYELRYWLAAGGMKQRVGIARSLAMEPKVLLMDEPFGALDALTGAHLQDSLMEIQTERNNTVIMVTHDVDEAVLLSDKIVTMTNGPAASVGEVLNVDLPRPRVRLELADDADYNHYRAAVIHFLHQKYKRNAA